MIFHDWHEFGGDILTFLRYGYCAVINGTVSTDNLVKTRCTYGPGHQDPQLRPTRTSDLASVCSHIDARAQPWVCACVLCQVIPERRAVVCVHVHSLTESVCTVDVPAWAARLAGASRDLQLVLYMYGCLHRTRHVRDVSARPESHTHRVLCTCCVMCVHRQYCASTRAIRASCNRNCVMYRSS